MTINTRMLRCRSILNTTLPGREHGRYARIVPIE